MSLVSVIIPVYNRPALVERAVYSVRHQTYPNIEIVIVDDGSDVGTKHLLQVLRARFQPMVRVVEQDNSGVGAAREAGRRVAAGSFIQYLDSDDILLPQKFELQVAALEKNPEASIAYGTVQYIDADHHVLDESYRETGCTRHSLFPELLRKQWWHTVAPLYRREIVDKVGAWKSIRFAEDWDYEARMGAERPVLVHVSEPVAQVQQHQEERLTRNTDMKTMVKDRASVFPVVLDCARRAEVDEGCEEMLFFSRWAFLVARQCIEFNLVDEGKACVDVARKSNGNSRWDVIAFYWFLRILGFSATRLLLSMVGRVRVR